MGWHSVTGSDGVIRCREIPPESDALWWGTNLSHMTPGRPRLILVVDTNVVLSSVDNDCRSGGRSWLLRITDAGTGRLFAAPHVYDECYRHLPKIAKSSRAPLEELTRRFQDEYLPRIRFVDPGPRVATDDAAAAVAMMDSDDEPTAVLASLLAPSLVVSGDKHLHAPGLAPADWRRLATAGAEVAAVEQAKAGLALAVVGSVSGSAAMVRWVGHNVGASPLALAALLGGLGTVWVGDSVRRAKAQARAAPLLTALVDLLAGLEAREQASLERVRAAEVPRARDRPPEQLVASLLARARKPLSVVEIHDGLAWLGADPAPLGMSQVRQAVRVLPGVCEGPRHRWQLGVRWEPRGSGG